MRSCDGMADQADKLLTEIGMFAVRLDGERRPVMFDAIIRAGLRAMRPNISDDAIRKVRAQIADFMIHMANSQRPAHMQMELEALREHVAKLEAKPAPAVAPLFTEAEMEYIRTLRQYGMKESDLATLYGVSADRIRMVLKRRDIPILWARKLRARVDSRKPRLLDVS